MTLGDCPGDQRHRPDGSCRPVICGRDKIQDVGDKAVSAYAETETAVSKVNAYFGETGAAAEASAEIVKNVYGSGVGQSMDAVAEAVIIVKKNLGIWEILT